VKLKLPVITVLSVFSLAFTSGKCHNPAIQDLEKSIELNNHRAVYRSQLLLDEDHAVRGSSLANLLTNRSTPSEL
jgi:hypothetical protein